MAAATPSRRSRDAQHAAVLSPAATPSGPGPAAQLPRQQVELLLVHLRKLVRAYKKRQQHVELLRTALQAKTDALSAQRIRLNEARLSSEGAQRDLRAAEEAISSLEFSRDNLIKRVDTLRDEVRRPFGAPPARCGGSIRSPGRAGGLVGEFCCCNSSESTWAAATATQGPSPSHYGVARHLRRPRLYDIAAAQIATGIGAFVSLLA